MTTNTNHAFASTNLTRIDLREDPSREAVFGFIVSASLLSILTTMAKEDNIDQWQWVYWLCKETEEGLKCN